MNRNHSKTWFVVGLRGLFGVAVGVASLFLPNLAMALAVAIFGLAAISDGLVSLAVPFHSDFFRGASNADASRQSVPTRLLRGVVGLLAGAFALITPDLTTLALVYVIAAWSIARGLVQFISAVHLERRYPEWVTGLGGALSILFGVSLAVSPRIGALALIWWVGAFALLLGLLLLIYAWRLRSVDLNAFT